MRYMEGSQTRVQEQLKLFDLEQEKPSKLSSNGRSAFSDPAFASNKTSPIHRWVPWIAGFSSNFVRNALDSYLHSKSIILDPFSGVGTTLVEAALAGHESIGFEINPYAALACRVKLNVCHIDIGALKKEILKLREFYEGKISADYLPKNASPEGFQTRADFYSPKVLCKVLIVRDFIDTVEDASLRSLFELAFAATMVSYSNYSYEPSLGRRVSSGKKEILDFPVLETILAKLAEMVEDIAWFQKKVPHRQVSTFVVNDSFFNYEKYLHPQSIDLVITSPPYLNNYHYNRNTRPQLYWLGYAKHPQDLKALENANFGKYWQTVREQVYLNCSRQ